MLNRCRAISRKPFFTSLTRTLEHAKIHTRIHTFAHAHTHSHTCEYCNSKAVCVPWNQVTPPLLSLLPSSAHPIFFILFIPLTASCPHLSRIYTPQAHKFNNSPRGTRITSKDHQLWLVSSGCSCFLPEWL